MQLTHVSNSMKAAEKSRIKAFLHFPSYCCNVCRHWYSCTNYLNGFMFSCFCDIVFPDVGKLCILFHWFTFHSYCTVPSCWGLLLSVKCHSTGDPTPKWLLKTPTSCLHGPCTTVYGMNRSCLHRDRAGTGWWEQQHVHEPLEPSEVTQNRSGLQASLPVVPSMY